MASGYDDLVYRPQRAVDRIGSPFYSIPTRELLGSKWGKYTGQTGLMQGSVYPPQTFDPNYRPEISPRSGGMLTPMTGNVPRNIFRLGTMPTDYRHLDTSSVLGGIQNRFGYSPRSNVPTSRFLGVGMNQPPRMNLGTLMYSGNYLPGPISF